MAFRRKSDFGYGNLDLRSPALARSIGHFDRKMSPSRENDGWGGANTRESKLFSSQSVETM
ncbi:hypothetical protein CEE69_02920 [Rhodopirellula bahusiensis]|uniref:Uncharacterized protein n=1 Tax=Rhodopirellula bahusiensis TaxID=2014065 RepID=A0A2G1WBF2_9BACT|nr:hypothetical protein CEE69_02920 [Rhodopirellula bahusiensis]